MCFLGPKTANNILIYYFVKKNYFFSCEVIFLTDLYPREIVCHKSFRTLHKMFLLIIKEQQIELMDDYNIREFTTRKHWHKSRQSTSYQRWSNARL